MHTPEELAAQLRAAHELAPSLVGLDRREAEEAAVRRGYYRTQVITPDVHAITADLDPFRIRLSWTATVSSFEPPPGNPTARSCRDEVRAVEVSACGRLG